MIIPPKKSDAEVRRQINDANLLNPLLSRSGDWGTRKSSYKDASPALAQDFFATSIVVDWNESNTPFDSLPVLFKEIELPDWFDLLRLYPITFDNGGTIQSPARTDLFLFAGNQQTQTPLFSFRYQDYLRDGAGFSNLTAANPISIFATVNRLQFRVDLALAATNTVAVVTDGMVQDQTTSETPVNARHRYGIRIACSRFGAKS